MYEGRTAAEPGITFGKCILFEVLSMANTGKDTRIWGLSKSSEKESRY